MAQSQSFHSLNNGQGKANYALPYRKRRPPTPVPPPVNTPTPAPANTPTPTPGSASHPLQVLLTNLPSPDDLLLAPDGSIYLSDVGAGIIQQFTPDGRLVGFLSGLDKPEGMVLLSDGSMVFAEQGQNRLMRYSPITKTKNLVIQFPIQANQVGIDGIAEDIRGPSPTLIVPDAPNGRILRVSLDGATVTTLSSAYQRPVGAWVEADGSILVVDENQGALTRLHPDGTIQQLAALATPDDVVEDRAGNIYVTCIGDGSVRIISGDGKRDIVLTDQLFGPQGLALDSQQNLVVSDPGNNRLVKIILQGVTPGGASRPIHLFLPAIMQIRATTP